MNSIWIEFFRIVLTVSVAYLMLNLLFFVYIKKAKNKRVSRWRWIYKTKMFSLPFALLIIIGSFININFEIHGIIVILLAVFGYRHLKNYVEGLFLRIQPKFSLGASVKCGRIEGRIIQITNLGIVLNTEVGERFVWYTSFEKSGFTILSNQVQSQRKTLYLKSPELSKNELQSLLFEHPILVIGDPFQINATAIEDVYRMEYTLEKGALNNDLIHYLQNLGIETSNTETFQ